MQKTECSGADAIFTCCSSVGEATDMLAIAGDPATHDRLVMADIERAISENDVVVLAQGSMARLVSLLSGNSRVPVLSSPQSGLEDSVNPP